MPLILKRQKAKVVHLNVREELHGESPVLAVDVKLETDLANDFLDVLEPGLRALLYRADSEQLPGVEQPLSIVRFAQLKPLHWEAVIPAASFSLHAAKKSEDLGFEAAVTKPLVLDPKEGGTVSLTLSVQVHPTPEELGKLSSLLGRLTQVSLQATEEGAGDAEREETTLTAEAPLRRTRGRKKSASADREWPFPKTAEAS